MHGLNPQFGVCLIAASREQPVQLCCGPVWADMVESVDLVLLPVCTNAVRSHLIQVYCRFEISARVDVVPVYFDCAS